MIDPRWQKAMERLGLCEGGYVIRAGLPLDPDDPATFKLVVEALLARNISVHLVPSEGVILVGDWQTKDPSPTLYAAVMEALNE